MKRVGSIESAASTTAHTLTVSKNPLQWKEEAYILYNLY